MFFLQQRGCAVRSPRVWLISGSRGYVGRNLTRKLKVNGINYIGFDIETEFFREPNFGINEYIGDYCDNRFIRNLLSNHEFVGVIHLAALKNVSDAIVNPDKYILKNYRESITFLDTLVKHQVKRIILASSAAVYGNQNTKDGFRETDKLQASNAYGKSKLDLENYIFNGEKFMDCSTIALRFFNIGGAKGKNYSDLSGDNLIPKLLRSLDSSTSFELYGNNFPTKDGTALRDYVHIDDVTEAILSAMVYSENQRGAIAVNIGSGVPTSVLEVIGFIESFSDKKIKIEVADPRIGDSYSSFSSIAAAFELLNWKPSRNISNLIESYFI